MNTCFRFAAILAFAGALPALTHSSFAIWPDDVNQQILVNTSTRVLETGSVPDGQGGIICVYHDFNLSTGQNILARRYGENGQLVWGSGPIEICTAAGDQTDIHVVPTTDGGCFIMWSDPRGGNYDVYVQKLAPSGQTLFSPNGSLYLAGTGDEVLEDAISDGFNGFILAYSQGIVLNARRFNSAGQSMWASPATISAVSGDAISDMIGDGEGGCYVGLERVGIGGEVVIQPISAAGVADFDQLLSLNAAGNQFGIKLARRSNGHVLAVWFDGAVSPQRLMANEFVDPLVFNPSVPLNTGSGHVLAEFELMESAFGDPVIVYGEQISSDNFNSYVGRVNTAGLIPVATELPGIGVSQSPDNVVETGNGNIRVTYEDSTQGANNRKLIAAQLSPTGQYQWHLAVTPSNAAFKNTQEARLVIGAQDSLIVFSTQVMIPGSSTAALIRVRANGTIGGQLALADYQFGQSSITATRKNKKATLLGNVVVRNGGTVVSSETTLAFFASPTPDFGPSGVVFLFEVAVPALQPNEEITLTPGLLPPKKPGKQPKVRKVKLPKAVKTTPHYLLLMLDSPNTYFEIDETNNLYVLGPI